MAPVVGYRQHVDDPLAGGVRVFDDGPPAGHRSDPQGKGFLHGQVLWGFPAVVNSAVRHLIMGKEPGVRSPGFCDSPDIAPGNDKPLPVFRFLQRCPRFGRARCGIYSFSVKHRNQQHLRPPMAVFEMPHEPRWTDSITDPTDLAAVVSASSWSGQHGRWAVV